MKRILTLTSLAAVVLIVSVNHAVAQRPWYRGNVREIIRQVEEGTDKFKSSLDSALDRHPLDGTRTEDEINAYVKRFEEATDRLRERSEEQAYAPNLAREVLTRGRAIDAFMRSHKMGGKAESDWVHVRNDLNRLANAYNIRWRW